MSRKNQNSHRLASNQSLAANFTTDPVNMRFQDNATIIIETSSITDNTGLFTIQVRNAQNKTGDEFSNWVTLDVAPNLSALSDLDNTYIIHINEITFTEMRISFTAAGSTPDGTVNIDIQTKVA